MSFVLLVFVHDLLKSQVVMVGGFVGGRGPFCEDTDHETAFMATQKVLGMCS